MSVLAVVGQVETTALEEQASAAGNPALRNSAARRARELGDRVADLSEEVLEIVPVGATIVVSWH